jgi:hypothetical protein
MNDLSDVPVASLPVGKVIKREKLAMSMRN